MLRNSITVRYSMASSNERHSKLVSWGTAFIVCLFAAYFFLLNRHVPIFADDYCRWREDFELYHVWSSTVGEYLGWTGRFPVMFLSYSFFSSGSIGIVLHDILNSFALGVACYLAVTISGCGRFLWCRVCLIVCFVYLLWFMPSVFGEVALWKTGAIQYFWGMVVATACLVPVIRFAVWDDRVALSSVVIPLYALLAFVGGAWLENLSPAVAVVWFALLLLAFLRGRKPLPQELVIGFLCWVAGAVILIVAPGNYERFELVASELSLWDRVAHVTRRLPGIPSLSLLYMLIGFLFVSILSQAHDLRRRFFAAAAFTGVAVLSAYTTIAAPVLLLVGRTAFATEYFLILAVVTMFPREVFLPPRNKLTGALRIAVLVTSVGLLVLLVYDMKGTFSVYRWVSKQEEQRKELIAAAQERGETTARLPPLRYGQHWNTGKGDVNYGRLFGRDISTEHSEWKNQCYARAHGLKSVVLNKQ